MTRPGETMEQAVARADRLMYQAKNRKKYGGDRGHRRHKRFHCRRAESQTRQNILIVDDSEMNRAILAEILGSDYNIVEAANGRECLAMLDQYDTGIALILLDIVMPVMDGFEVLNVMNRNHWIEDYPGHYDFQRGLRTQLSAAPMSWVSRTMSAAPLTRAWSPRRVFNTIKLYAKQRRLISLVTSRARGKEKNVQMMVSILSEIVEFRNGESGATCSTSAR